MLCIFGKAFWWACHFQTACRNGRGGEPLSPKGTFACRCPEAPSDNALKFKTGGVKGVSPFTRPRWPCYPEFYICLIYTWNDFRCTKNVRQIYKKCTPAWPNAYHLVLKMTWHGFCFFLKWSSLKIEGIRKGLH